MTLPDSYETVLDKIKQDWFHLGWEAARFDAEVQANDDRLFKALGIDGSKEADHE